MFKGDRWSFEAVLFWERGGEAGILGFDRRGRAEGVVGDLDARADPELDLEELGSRVRRAADRVTGAKYSSFASEGSDIEGVGEITRGVSGKAFGEDISAALNLNGGNDATRKTVGSSLVRSTALLEASMPQGTSGLANEVMVGDCYKRSTGPC